MGIHNAHKVTVLIEILINDLDLHILAIFFLTESMLPFSVPEEWDKSLESTYYQQSHINTTRRLSVSRGIIPANICWSWRRLEDVLEQEKLLRWRHLEDVLKTCLQDVLKTYLEDVLKTLWRETKFLLGISVSNKSKCVSNKSIISQIYIWQF